MNLTRWNSEAQPETSKLSHQLHLQGYVITAHPLRPSQPVTTIEADQEHCVWIARGTLELTCEGIKEQLKAGDCAHIPPGSTYSYEVISKDMGAFYLLGKK